MLAFQASVTAATPLEQAPPLQVAALVEQGEALIRAVDAALVAAGAPLGAEEPSGHPTAMIASVLAVVAAGEDHRTLHDMRGFLGRAVLNLAQASA